MLSLSSSNVNDVAVLSIVFFIYILFVCMFCIVCKYFLATITCDVPLFCLDLLLFLTNSLPFIPSALSKFLHFPHTLVLSFSLYLAIKYLQNYGMEHLGVLSVNCCFSYILIREGHEGLAHETKLVPVCNLQTCHHV